MIDTDYSNTLSKEEFQRGLSSMNIYLEKNKIDYYIDKYDSDKNGRLEPEEFKNICTEIQFKIELEDVFNKYCKNYK